MTLPTSLQTVKTRRRGTHVFISFTSPLTGKRRRLKKKETGLLPDKEAAEAWIAEHLNKVINRELELLARQEWRRASDLVQLSNQFREYKKREHPKSVLQIHGALENYVLPFFVVDQGLSDPNTWHPEHQKFKAWLLAEATSDKDQKLSVSTANKAINSLNKFCEWLRDHARVLKWDSCRPLQAYPNRMLNRRSVNDLVDDREFEMLLEFLVKKEHFEAADVWVLQRHTGMRLSEALGLSLTSLTTKVPEEVTKAYSSAGLNTMFGAVYLDSQPADAHIVRVKNEIARAPLKWRPEISPKYARTIPILDKTVWNILAARFKAQRDLFSQNHYGPNKASYLLFDCVQRNDYLGALREAYAGIGLRPKGSHCLRHTRITELTMAGIPDKILELVMGNKKLAQERYQHMIELLNRKSQEDFDLDEIKEVG